jgi:putative glutamine amidotransferase
MMTIGLTCSYDDENNLTEKQQQNLEYYRLALRDAGAEMKVLFLPDSKIPAENLQQIAATVCDDLQGLVISGGADLPPEMFGAAPDPNLGELVPSMRPAFEKELVTVMLAQQKPVLGICYGAQLLNVLEGGSLIQDIPSRCPDAIEHREGARHAVHTEHGTRLREYLGENFEVASYHHQSIEKIALTARLAALAPDGIIEAVEFPKYHFCIGVQWHPERTRESDATHKLMKNFVNACRSNDGA